MKETSSLLEDVMNEISEGKNLQGENCFMKNLTQQLSDNRQDAVECVVSEG